MNKTITSKPNQKIAVDIKGLQEMLSVGRKTAVEIAENANAVIYIGRRKLFIVERVRTYLNEMAEAR